MVRSAASIIDVCNYIVVKLIEAGDNPSHLKLQKLAYYAQAWHLAIYNEPLFFGKFQAWIHGPVSRDIYDRFRNKSLYSPIEYGDLWPASDFRHFSPRTKLHLDEVLNAYGSFSGSELEDMSHNEAPWIEARRGYFSQQRCEVELNEITMGDYYRKRMM